MSDKNQKKKFIKVPRYLGSKKSFQEFVAANLVYPPEALKNKIEGVVHLSYMVNDKGGVYALSVDHGIGFGCDDEALRLVRMMKFAPVKNRGMKVSSKQRTRIEFRLPKTGPTYNVTLKSKEPEAEHKQKVTYTYTIRIGKEGS